MYFPFSNWRRGTREAFYCSSAYVQKIVGILNESRFKKRFYSHVSKTSSINSAENFFLNIIHDRSDKESIFIKNNEDIEGLEEIKLRSLYSDFFDDGLVTKPSEIYKKDFAKKAVKWLFNRIQLLEKIGVIGILRKGELSDLDDIDKFKEILSHTTLNK